MRTMAAHLKSWFRFAGKRSLNRASFEALFNRFREVLARNNRSLELITDMGDTLSGDYLFDINYVRKAYAELSVAMNDSLLSFNDLTQGRYPLLRGRFLAIDEQIKHVIEETVPASKGYVVFYEDVSEDRVRDIGGKNHNLALIRNALKLSVPDAFSVTTRAFDAFMEHNRIFEKTGLPEDGSPASEAALQKIRELVLHGEMPPVLGAAIDKAVKKIGSRCAGTCFLAVRSSAGEEDGDFSFAGQFDTVLNVPLERGAVEKAYKKVLASLYSGKSSIYQKRLGYELRGMKMAVGCMVMVDAAASGVVYSTNPQGDRDTLLINATWGLGTSIVEGRIDADSYTVDKNDGQRIIETRIGTKDSMVVRLEQGGVMTVATQEEKRTRSALSPSQIAELSRLALRIERYFRTPQDIEFAMDDHGRLTVLQSRSLRLPDKIDRHAATETSAPDSRVIIRNKGLAVQKGVAAGRVFVLKNINELDSIPKGAILVARHDSSHFVRVMTHVSAIITDIGTTTSHMAALCREFRIPTVVGTGNFTRMLEPGEEITIQVESEGVTVYQGRVRALLEGAETGSVKMDELFEFRKKRYVLRSITPLNLVDPLRDEFTPQACKTMHDILRFIHEKSVAEVIESAEMQAISGAIKLDLPIPAGIMLIDIGGGLHGPVQGGTVVPDQVASLPLRAIISGMTRPGIWRSDAVPLGANDFMASMLRMPDLTSNSGRVESNMAIISREYANLSLKFGYHFIVMDCYCSENAKDNHIYFRFTGGATDMTKRSRRLRLIAAILGEFGFTISAKGDLIVARVANIRQEEAETILDQIGRLISYTRQLDAVLNDDRAIERYTKMFFEGNSNIECSTMNIYRRGNNA